MNIKLIKDANVPGKLVSFPIPKSVEKKR